MRNNERKGAWTLLIGVLLFGALVWGLGGRQMREDRASETAGDSTEEVKVISDSISVDSHRSNGKRSRRARRSARARSASKSSTSAAPTRDILADTIPSSCP